MPGVLERNGVDNLLSNFLHHWTPPIAAKHPILTSFEESPAPGHKKSSTEKEDKFLDWRFIGKAQAGPNSATAPLCEDLEDRSLEPGDRCWSTCHGQCPSNVLQPGLVFDFDEIKVGHPGCVSHFECIGNYDRVLCHATDKAEAAGLGGWWFW